MSEPFLAEIRLMSFANAPKGWAQCNGQTLPINQNQPLFALLGTNFGGDGRTTFGLPDFRGRVPIHVGNKHTNGEKGGEQAHTLSIAELPTHTHALMASQSQGDKTNPRPFNVPTVFAADPGNAYGPAQNLAALNAASVGNVGGSQAHLNMQPFLTLTFCIALQGIFPSPN